MEVLAITWLKNSYPIQIVNAEYHGQEFFFMFCVA